MIVPCYAEQDNVRELVRRLVGECDAAGITLDCLFVDDESAAGGDGAARARPPKGARGQGAHPPRYKKRGRLASAVILGFRMAKYDTLLCMDSDLQHEPEAVPSVAAPVLDGEAEYSVGSRFTDGGEIGKDWPAHRRLISWVATLLAQPLARTTDPMSGFFCLRKDVFERGVDSCKVAGFKISLELMARCKPATIKDVGISFKERVAGESKLTVKQNIEYLQQLATLYVANYLPLLVVLFVVLASVLWKVAQLTGYCSGTLHKNTVGTGRGLRYTFK